MTHECQTWYLVTRLYIFLDLWIFFGSPLKYFPLEITILMTVELIEDLKKNIRTWGCRISRIRVITLWKGSRIFLFSTGQIFCQKVLYHIVVMISTKRFRIVMHGYAASFSIKTLFCKTNNIFYSLQNRIWNRSKWWFWKYIKNKAKITLENFQNFAYVSYYLHFKSFSWKRDYVISQKLQIPQTQ